MEGRVEEFRSQLGQVEVLKSRAVESLHSLSELSTKLDLTLRPVKEATESLSRGLGNIERALKMTGDTLEQIEASRKLQHYIDMGLPRCSTIEGVEEDLSACKRAQHNTEEEQQKEAFDLASGEEFDDTSLVAEDDKELGKVKEYLLAVEKLEMSMRFLDAHFGGVGSPRGLRERSRTRDSLTMALTHCEVEFSNRLMFVSQIEKQVLSESGQEEFRFDTIELREDVLQHRRDTLQEEAPESPEKFSKSTKISYLMRRRKKELRMLNMLAEAILKHTRLDTISSPTTTSLSLSEGIFSSYADVRSTSLEEKIKKTMLGHRMSEEDGLMEKGEGGGMLTDIIESHGEMLGSDEEDTLEKLLKSTAEEIQHMHWEDIKKHAQIWIQYVENTLSQVMHERNFARKIFVNAKDSDSAFALVMKSHFDTIVSQALGICKSRKTPEKVFALLDMLNAWDKEKALTTSLTEMGSAGGDAKVLANKLHEMYWFMVNSVRDTYLEFTNALERDVVGQSKKASHGSSSTPKGKKIHGGSWTPSKRFKMLMNMDSLDNQHNQNSIPENCTIHPLAAYLIQYCRRLQDHPNASSVLTRRSNSEAARCTEEDEVMAKIIVRLLNMLYKNLKLKVQRRCITNNQNIHSGGTFSRRQGYDAEQEVQSFNDLFMLNNGNYILKSAESFKYCAALERSGFINEMKENVRRFKNSYIHASWRLIVEWLEMIDETLKRHQNVLNTKDSAESEKQLKNLLKQVQNTWKFRYRTQRTWYVPDPELRQSLKSRLEQYVLPAFVKVSKALDTFAESSGQAYWKRMFPLMWEEGTVRKQIELQLFEGHYDKAAR